MTRTGRGIVHSNHPTKDGSLSTRQVQRDKTIDAVAQPVTGQQLTSVPRRTTVQITARDIAVDPSRQTTDAAIAQEQSISVPRRAVHKTARKSAADALRLTFTDATYSTTSQGQSISVPRVARKVARKRATEPFRRVEFLSAPAGATRPVARTRAEKTRQDSPIDSSDSEALPFSPSFPVASASNGPSSGKPPSAEPSQPSTGSGPQSPSLARLSATHAGKLCSCCIIIYLDSFRRGHRYIVR